MTSDPPADAPHSVAVIDIGASAIRLLIAEVLPDGSTRTLETASRGVRLGRDAFTRGALSGKTVEAACDVLRDFGRIMAEYDVGEVRAVATSAVRESGNRDTFLDRVALRTGIDVEVLDAAEENRLTFQAVHTAFKGRPEMESEDALVVEVGGGSTDLAFVRAGAPSASGTYALGAIRIREQLTGLTGGRKAWVRALRDHIRNVVRDIRREIPLKRVNRFIGVGGDMRFVARHLESVDGDETIRVLPREPFLDFSRQLAKLPVEDTVARFRTSYAEAENLGPAILVYRELLRATPAPEILVPRVSLRDAILAELARSVRGEAEEEFRSQVLASVESIAEKFQANLRHARRVATLCDRLFEDMRDLHGLGERARTLLQAAAILHDIGLFVSLSAHHKHSEYLIRASQIFGLKREERLVVACVARYHRRALPRRTHPNFTSLPRAARLAVSKLGAILRLANALDRGHGARVRSVRAREEDGRWALRVEATGELDAERLAVEKRSDLFQEVFGFRIELRVEPIG